MILLGRLCNAYYIISSYVADHVGFRGRDDSSSSRYKLDHLQDLDSSGKRRSIWNLSCNFCGHLVGFVDVYVLIVVVL